MCPTLNHGAHCLACHAACVLDDFSQQLMAAARVTVCLSVSRRESKGERREKGVRWRTRVALLKRLPLEGEEQREYDVPCARVNRAAQTCRSAVRPVGAEVREGVGAEMNHGGAAGGRDATRGARGAQLQAHRECLAHRSQRRALASRAT